MGFGVFVRVGELQSLSTGICELWEGWGGLKLSLSDLVDDILAMGGWFGVATARRVLYGGGGFRSRIGCPRGEDDE